METTPSLEEQRASIGLTTPRPEERDYLWSQVTIGAPADISPETGGYRPHRVIKHIHDGPWRFLAIGGGLRGGKSLSLAMEVIAWLPHSQLIWLAAQTYDKCRQEFDYILDAAQSLGWVKSYSKPRKKYDPCYLETTWGCVLETKSLHDLGSDGGDSSLVARAPDFIGICEPGFAPAETLKQARERLTTRRGRLWMAGTFEKANIWFVETWEKWTRWPNDDMGKSFAVPSWLNTKSFPGGRHDPEILQIERAYPNLREFLVRWGGIPLKSEALVMGAYFDEKKHVRSDIEFQPYDREGAKLPVYLMVDPGFSGDSVYAVLAAQKFGNAWVVIDEVAVQSLVHEEVIDQCRTHPWWSHVVGGIIDPYAGVNHIYGSLSPQEIWWRYGRVSLQPSIRLDVEDVVSRLQFVMRDPQNATTKVTFSDKCVRLVWEMLHWRRKRTREGLGAPSDINCDAVKALAYFMSAKYTEEQLGYNPGQEPVQEHDWYIGGGRGGRRLPVDRYRDKEQEAPDADW